LKRKSLLAVGVKEVLAPFKEGEAIEITDIYKNVFAVARAKISSKELLNSDKQQKLLLAHADDIVLM
jgi:glutamate 5-kinase